MEDTLEGGTADNIIKRSSSHNVSSNLAYNKDFVRTTPGLLFFAEIVFGLLVWILIGGTEYVKVPALSWVMCVSVVCWVLTVFFYIFHLTVAHTRIPQIPLNAMGLCFNGSASVLYLLAAAANSASLSQATKGRYYYHSWVASTVFAYLATFCYAGNTYFSFKSWRSKNEES